MYGEVFGVGRRIAMEVKRALTHGMLSNILT
jgi:5-formaminoimidazole-4-carboxamide-1-beta-D-ribofuranosyl 5'-monophosphate synthetase